MESELVAARGREPPPTGIRLGCVVTLAMVVTGFLAVVAFSVWSGGAGSIDLGLVEDYERGSVVYRSSDGLFVVRLADGSMLALSDVDPHNPSDRASCKVTFRPDLVGGDGEAGRFFDLCTGSLYDMAGRALGSDGLDLERLPIERDGDRLRVRSPGG